VTDQDRAPHGGGDGGADNRYDPKLAARILSAIADYNRDHETAPSPGPLRDTMLAVAALLHLDATRAAHAFPTYEAVFEAFADGARDQLRAVIEAKSAKPSPYKQ
jgi:hypothetical protein